MDFAYLLGGGAPVIKKYQVDETFSTAGVWALESASGESGVDLSTATGFANALGVTLDTATKQTAQQAVGTTAAELLSVIINPNAVYRGRLSGSSTSGTALTQFTVTTASTDGLSVITDNDPNSPDLADGVVWGYTGANVGQFRKITATAANDATVEIPFDVDIAVGDVFLLANRFEGDIAGVTLTSALDEVDAQAAEATTGALRVVEMELHDSGREGNLTSNFLLLAADHAYSGAS